MHLSTLGFGAASLGNLYREIDDQSAREAIAAAAQIGMRYFDTAPFYGFGLSERRAGDFLRTLDREQFVLSTKVGRVLEPAPLHKGSEERHGFCSPMPFEPVYDYSYDGVMRSYEASLARLGLARIDILLVHDIGAFTHGEENQRHFRALSGGGVHALQELKAAGDISAVGLGVNEYQVCEDVMEIGQWDCFLLAGRYSLLEQNPLDGFMEKCLAHGATLIIGGAYNSGILATGVRHGTAYYNYAPAPRGIVEKVEKIEDICDAHGVLLPAAAIQFPAAHQAVSSVGDRSRRQGTRSANCGSVQRTDSGRLFGPN